MLDTPILIIAWKRADKTLELIKSIRKVSPRKVYLACDGAIKEDNENKIKVKQTRDILDNQINWDCEVNRLYSENHNGCREGVSKAINWFFLNEEEGIILEDDCIPHIDFFYFSSEMLKKYKNDSRIWCISAHNNQMGKKYGDGSYYFSRYCHCWGWASWRRCWQNYDANIKDWPELKKKNFLNNILDNKRQKKYWERIFDDLYLKGKPDTWDYQWTYLCFKNSGFTIIPNVNLIKNIGFDNDATHTITGNPKTNNLELNRKDSGIFPLIHPNLILRSKKADLKVENLIYSGFSFFSYKYYLQKLKNFFSKLN